MAEGNGDSGSKDRATVALVASEVREVKAIMSGHAEATAAKLDAITDKMAPLAGIPDRVTRLEEKVAHILEKYQSAKESVNWRRGALVTVTLAGSGALLNLAISLHWFG